MTSSSTPVPKATEIPRKQTPDATSVGRPDWVNLLFWPTLVALGLVETWNSRHLIFSDGVSYIDIAKYYLQGDWHSALNSYWSPLYSWLLALAFGILRPSPYWEISMLHVVNFLAYLIAAYGFHLCLREILSLTSHSDTGLRLSAQTIRISASITFLICTLLMIDINYVSPDMVSTAILIFVAYLLIKIRAGKDRTSTYIGLGVLLGLEYLARAAFFSFILLYLVILCIVLWQRNSQQAEAFRPFKPVVLTALSALLVIAPFITALSIDKGRFTLGDAGKLNYGWEVDGAARSAFWLGEPGDIGQPIHPPRLKLDHPRVFEFATQVPGSYPPWYEPSYWYQGIKPHLKLGPQVRVLISSLALLAYLFVRSPVTIPVLMLIPVMGFRRWLSREGILGTWFLWLPSLLFIGGFCLVFLDSRYIGGSLLVIWLCMLTSLSLQSTRIRRWANMVIQAAAAAAFLWILFGHLRHPLHWALSDLYHFRESDKNLQWEIAQGMRDAGLRPGDRIAVIGEGINYYWASMDGAKIVAEVGVRWDRFNDLKRVINTNYGQIDAYWKSSPAVRQQVLTIFRNAGAKFVITDNLPADVDTAGWQTLFSAPATHIPHRSDQMDRYATIAFRRLQ